MTYTLNIQPVGLSCPVTPDQTILDAALADGLMLKHSCRTGTCGSCKAVSYTHLTLPTKRIV